MNGKLNNKIISNHKIINKNNKKNSKIYLEQLSKVKFQNIDKVMKN